MPTERDQRAAPIPPPAQLALSADTQILEERSSSSAKTACTTGQRVRLP
jgi:hypothetical protein